MTDETSTPIPDPNELSPNDQKMMATAPTDDVDDPEKPEFELTPEQKEILDQKRQRLLTDPKFAFRFVNSKEYYNLLKSDSTPRQIETSTQSLMNLQQGSERGHLIWTRADKEPGASARLWSGTADQVTSWHEAAAAINTPWFLYREYRDLWENAKKENRSREEAREVSIDKLKSRVTSYFDQLTSSTKQKDLLGTPNSIIDDDNRLRLKHLLDLSPREFSRFDIRFMIRFARGDSHIFRIGEHIDNPELKSGDTILPYELLEIWPAETSNDELNSWNTTMGFTAIEKDVPTSELLGVVVFSPGDKEQVEQIAERMINASANNPEKAHVVIDPKFFEFFPEEGTDFMQLPT